MWVRAAAIGKSRRRYFGLSPAVNGMSHERRRQVPDHGGPLAPIRPDFSPSSTMLTVARPCGRPSR
jgi:hypothetical protein